MGWLATLSLVEAWLKSAAYVYPCTIEARLKCSLGVGVESGRKDAQVSFGYVYGALGEFQAGEMRALVFPLEPPSCFTKPQSRRSSRIRPLGRVFGSSMLPCQSLS